MRKLGHGKTWGPVVEPECEAGNCQGCAPKPEAYITTGFRLSRPKPHSWASAYDPSVH